MACFFFAFKSGVNAGIISTIFSSSCIFTIVIFYFKYGHQISLIDFIGTCFILLCVVMIALGGTGGSDSEEVKTEDQIAEEKVNLVMALIFAIISGFCLSMNTVGI
jgi:drug/metabolite transporter (DMT)-like permease